MMNALPLGWKLGFSVLAMVLSIVAFLPYILGILKGKTRPHVFSWVIWSLTTSIVSLAQFTAGGGYGAWATAVSAAITFYIAMLSFRHRHDVSISLADRVFFVAALAALPLWYATSDPTWAVVLLTTVDVLGFAPTLRKAWHRPHEENTSFFAWFLVRSVFAVLALDVWSVATVLFPAAIAVACGVLIVVVLVRRQQAEGVG